MSAFMSPKLWVALAFAALLALLGAQTIHVEHVKAELADTKAANAKTLTGIANLTVAALREGLATAQAKNDALTRIDALSTKGKEDALQQNEAIRAAVRAGTQRLRVAAVCPAGGGGPAPQEPSAASVGDAPTVELSAAAGQNILDIRAGIIADQAALTFLQGFTTEVCAK